jgi:hypothetical protein
MNIPGSEVKDPTMSPLSQAWNQEAGAPSRPHPTSQRNTSYTTVLDRLRLFLQGRRLSRPQLRTPSVREFIYEYPQE